MRVLVSGASGLIGSALCPALTTAGHSVVRLVRRPARPSSGEVQWDPEGGVLHTAALEQDGGPDWVIHLAGESIGARRWTREQKARIRSSRIKGTRLLAGAVAKLRKPPIVFVSASAVGFYGNRDEELNEASAPGTGFLADVAREWEAAALPAAEAGCRLVSPRFGIVLSRDGGALEKMLPPFRIGAGGPFGDGRQWMSWIHIEDVVGALLFLLEDAGLEGPVNLTAPNPVRNKEFAATVGRVLHRPALVPAPSFALKMILGSEMAQALLLDGQRALPCKLQHAGYRFRFPELEPALEDLLGSDR